MVPWVMGLLCGFVDLMVVGYASGGVVGIMWFCGFYSYGGWVWCRGFCRYCVVLWILWWVGMVSWALWLLYGFVDCMVMCICRV